MPSKRPNILWYCTDQQRFDTIRALGNSEIHTPTLDGLMDNGVAFTRAYCQSPICTPSRGSFLTGRYPASTHVHRNGNVCFPGNEKLVTKMFAEAGYDCGLIGKLHLSAAQGKIERRNDDGYRFYAWSHHPYPDIEGNTYTEWLRDEKGLDPTKLFAGISGSYGDGLPEELHQTTWCTEMALRFIDEKRESPWLLSMNPFSPHPTFHPPKEYRQRYDSSKLSYPIFRNSDIPRQQAFRDIDQQTIDAVDPRTNAAGDDPRTANLPKDQLASLPPSSYDARELKACYYAEIELVDHQLGRILDRLRETGELSNTIVVFMSDHGELLGDHGLLFKGCRFFESLVHVPLIISWPEGYISDVRSDALVELVDIAPTLLEAAEEKVPENMQGVSLTEILTGRSKPSVHRPHVVSEYNDAMGLGTTTSVGHAYAASHGTMYYDGRYKMAVYHGIEIGELYDLETDPYEFENLWDNPEVEKLKLKLLKRHFDAVMATSDAGPKRVKDY